MNAALIALFVTQDAGQGLPRNLPIVFGASLLWWSYYFESDHIWKTPTAIIRQRSSATLKTRRDAFFLRLCGLALILVSFAVRFV